MKTKILITIRGGNVETIMSNDKNMDIIIVDHDNIDAGGEPISGIIGPDYFVKEKENGEKFYERFTDESSPTEMEIRDELKKLKF